jgi:hypothetical protein
VLAEGATTPETFRQKDCNNFKIWREVHKDKKALTEGDGYMLHIIEALRYQ